MAEDAMQQYIRGQQEAARLAEKERKKREEENNRANSIVTSIRETNPELQKALQANIIETSRAKFSEDIQMNPEAAKALEKVNASPIPSDVQKYYTEKANPQEKFEIMASYGVLPSNAVYTGNLNGEPTYKMGSGVDSFVMSKEFLKMLVDMTVPLVYTIGNWNKLSAGEKALNVALDAVFFLPFIPAAARGARATTAITKAGRFKGAAGGVGRELMVQATGPVDILLHPVKSIKGTARQSWDTIENIGSYKKLPEAVISTTEGTVRIPVTADISAKEAAVVRTAIMKAAAETGSDIVMEFNGHRYTISRSALMKELGGGFAHATPQGDVFIEGLKVNLKPGMSAVEQGLFVSHEPLPRFAKGSAFGQSGEMPTIFITSSETAQDAINTAKIYKSPTGKVAELERKFPVNYVVPEPAQILYTRIGPEKVKTAIMLEKPLTPRQILKLKSLALIEDIKAPFKPALLIEGKNIKGAATLIDNSDDLKRLIGSLERTGNRELATNLRAVYKSVEASRLKRISQNRAKIATGTISGTRNGRRDDRDIVITSERIGRPETRASGKRTPVRNVRITNTETRRGDGNDRTDRTAARGERETVRTDRTAARGERETVRTDRTAARGINENIHPRLTTGSYQQKARDIVKNSGGAIAYRMGKIGNKTRWDVITYPYTSNENYYMILGSKPVGATIVRRGKGSAYGTTQVISGVAPKRNINIDSGFADIEITPVDKRSVKMRVTPDPRMETTGDITIGRSTPRISDRRGSITGRTPRISRKVPKLR